MRFPVKLLQQERFVIPMNNNFYRFFIIPDSRRTKHTRFPRPSKTALPTALTALACCLFFAVTPTRAQSVPHVVPLGKTLLVYGTVPMIIPQGGAHTRQAEIFIPAKFNGEPSITATVYSTQSPGTMFAICNIKVNDLGSQTQVAFSAANVQIAIPSSYSFVCNYVITGMAR
jgi:hypothetical protein